MSTLENQLAGGSPRWVRANRLFGGTCFLVAQIVLCASLCSDLQLYAQEPATSRQPATPFHRYGPYRLPIDEVANVELMFETDLDIVIPEFDLYSRSDPSLIRYISGGFDIAAERFGSVLEQTGWGHLVPYVYAAAYRFLGRIYYGLSSQPTLADGTSLLPKETLTAGRITIRLISDEQIWRGYVQRIGHSTANAYWDPLRAEAGAFVDRAMFVPAASQATWSGRGRIENVARLESYVTRLFIRELGHELFHAIQQRTPSPAYSLPAMAEGAALYAQHNAFMREEIVRLSEAQVVYAAPSVREQIGSDCYGEAFAGNWRGDYYTIDLLHRANRYVRRRPNFSLTGLIAMEPDRFYRASASDLFSRYAVAFSVHWFLLDLDEEKLAFWRDALPNVEGVSSKRVKEAALAIDLHYRAWLDALGRRYWDNPQAEQLFVAAANKVTECLNARQFPPTWMIAVQSGAYVPGNPTTPLYLGDLYWRTANFDSAFEYYSVANEVAQPLRYGEAPSRIKSRLGDAAEQLGRVEMAVELFREVSEMPLEHPQYFLVFARSMLKYEYYQLTEADGTWHSENSRIRLNRYVQALQSPVNTAAAQRLARQGDWDAFMNLVLEQYRDVRARMYAELRAGSPPM